MSEIQFVPNRTKFACAAVVALLMAPAIPVAAFGEQVTEGNITRTRVTIVNDTGRAIEHLAISELELDPFPDPVHPALPKWHERVSLALQPNASETVTFFALDCGAMHLRVQFVDGGDLTSEGHSDLCKTEKITLSIDGKTNKLIQTLREPRKWW
jgi:hypothetical protein